MEAAISRGERAACAFHCSAANLANDLGGGGISVVDIDVDHGGDGDPPISVVSSLRRKLRSI